MKHSLVIGQRVLRELSKDKRLFGLSIVGPFILIYFLKIFIDKNFIKKLDIILLKIYLMIGLMIMQKIGMLMTFYLNYKLGN